MEISLKEFNQLLRDNLIEVLWKQWTTLGVVSNVQKEKNWVIDIEALLVSTFILGNYDKRLFSASMEWLIKNGEWVNTSRLNRMGKDFILSIKNIYQEPFPTDTIVTLLDHFKKGNKKGIKERYSLMIREAIPNKYREILENFKVRGIISEPVMEEPVLLQLFFRGLFGINARVEVMIYLLSKESGNSLSISKEISYDQKIIYRILEDWVKTGQLEKRRREGYYLKTRKEWLNLLNIQKMPEYINWVKVFSTLPKMVTAFSTEPWSKNKYMASSFFRDIQEEIKPIAKSLNIKLPEPSLYKGEEYFTPFAKGILKMSKKLKGKG